MNASFIRFPWPRALVPGWLLLLSLLSPQSGYSQDQPRPEASEITILAPAPGTRVFVPGVVVLEAQAVDPIGDIRHLEFFANGEFIGASDYLLKIAVIPGRPIPHRLEWKVEKPGDYQVVARAKDTAGKEVVSKPLAIVAESLAGDLPIVGVKATREATSEPRPEARIAPGQFTVHRSGSVAQPLTVLVLYSGSATAGLDYTKLPNEVTIPAGRSEQPLDVIALDDNLLEGDESVVIEIVHPPIPIDPLALRVQLPKPTYRIGDSAQAKVVIHDADREDDATIRLVEPEPGDRFPYGPPIRIRAVAVDPKGAITRLEFFAGEESIGRSEIVFIREPDPGTPIEHVLEWKGAKAGEHWISARGTDSKGLPVDSVAVPIIVGVTESEVVVLEVEAADAKAVEPGANGQVDPGVFVIRRIDGPKGVSVPVSYSLEGGALNGIDYERLSGRVELPAGVEAVRVAITPIADKALEGEEKVALVLESPVCPAIFPPPPQCYRIAASGSAVVVIQDGGGTKDLKPTVKIVSPSGGSSYPEGDVIRVHAEAQDTDGEIERLDIFADGELLGSAKAGELIVEWKTASAGLHRLTARAVDNSGSESTSPVVTVLVRAIEDIAFVKRDLPPAYLPGTAVEVLLLADPPRGGAAWTVEETPPSGWTVSEISDEGVFDATTGRVKFGPFTDGQSRRLSYRATSPTTATGSQKFSGRSSLDGRSLPVGGDDTLLPAGEHHPADANPANKVIVADELTAYAAAWKRGVSWGEDGGTIPLTYVTRAGLIWKSGEAYRFDPAAGGPPACWVPSATRPANTRALSGGVSVASSEAEVGADRIADAVQRPGAGSPVVILVKPPAGTMAVAVEESIPAGWSISGISDDGQWDPVARRIRWGLYFGDDVRRLTYVATPPAGQSMTALWNGQISFDGVEVPIRGAERVGAGDSATLPRIRASKREGHGVMRFQVDAPIDQAYAVEVSSDLKAWMEIGVVVHTGADVVVDDRLGEGAAHRYYRLRPVHR